MSKEDTLTSDKLSQETVNGHQANWEYLPLIFESIPVMRGACNWQSLTDAEASRPLILNAHVVSCEQAGLISSFLCSPSIDVPSVFVYLNNL